MKCTAAAIALATALAGGAYAGDFSGAYIETGFGLADIDSNEIDSGVPESGFGGTATTIGVSLGYSHEFAGGWVVSAEGGVDAIIEADDADFSDKSTFEISDSAILNVEASLGKPVSEDLLAYGAVGYEAWEIDSSGATDTLQGASFALGLEYMFANSNAVVFEVKHTEFDRSESRGFNAASISPDATRVSIALKSRF